MAHNPQPVHIDPNDRYEKSDVSIGTIPPYLFALFLFMGITAAITYVIYKIYVPDANVAVLTAKYPVPTIREVPPGPLIQGNPVEDIETMRHNEEAELHTDYGRDPVSKELLIPVDRAMDLVAQEGLPTRPQPGKIDVSEPNEPTHAEGQASEMEEYRSGVAPAVQANSPAQR